MPHADEPRHYRAIIAVIVSTLVVLLVWWFWAVYGVRRVYRAISPIGASAPGVTELGQVGDLFGGVNALFAALAVVGVFWAGYLQRRALIETRLALSQERAAGARQQFEATLFQLLSLFRGILDGLELHLRQSSPFSGVVRVSQAAAVNHILGDRGDLAQFFSSTASDPERALLWHSGVAHSDVFNENEAGLGTLFRTLAAVFEHIDGLTLDHPEEASRYAGIVKDQLSNSLVTLFAFYAEPQEAQRFRKIVIRFELLAAIRKDEYLKKVLTPRFGLAAFGAASPSPLVES